MKELLSVMIVILRRPAGGGGARGGETPSPSFSATAGWDLGGEQKKELSVSSHCCAKRGVISCEPSQQEMIGTLLTHTNSHSLAIHTSVYPCISRVSVGGEGSHGCS